MELKRFIKEKYKILSIITLVSVILGALFYRYLGAKDTLMFMLGTEMLLIEIFLIFIDKKASVLLFIISFPVIVTARKVCYFDLLFLRISYETIYITAYFIINYRSLIKKISEFTKTSKSREFRFMMYIFVFIIFAFVSCIFSTRAMHSLSEIYISVLIPFVFMLMVLTVFTKEDKGKIALSLIFSIDLSCLYGFFQIATNRTLLSSVSSNRDQLTFGYHNVNIFACILMAIVPYLLKKILYEENSKIIKLFLYLSLMVNVLALFLTYTRGGWLTFVIVVFLILISKKYRKLIYIMIAGGVILVKPVLTYILNRGTSTSIFVDESAIARVQSIFTSTRIIIRNPYGVGPGNFAAVFKENLRSGYLDMPQKMRWDMHVANYTLENAHNLWLQIGVEYGLVCLVFFMLIVINRLVVAFLNYEDNRDNIISIVTFLIFSITTGIEFNHKGVITGNLILWLVFALIQMNKSKENLSDGK